MSSMFSAHSCVRVNLKMLCAALLAGQLISTAHAAPLKGGVQVDHHLNNESMRISRPAQTPMFNRSQGTMDSAQKPLAGRAQDSGNPLKGLLNDSDFMKGKPAAADLDEDKSREMVLAWERWHKQLSGAIYERWSDVARYPGVATVKITVTKNNAITASILNSTGTPAFNSGLLASIESLDGNPGLTFPSGSRRQIVTYQADYVAGRNINPGYTWVKNDYERVREN
jgi:hypothetical protein